MITFNPGPSQISPQVKDFMREFIDQDIGSISHRSKQFTEISLSLRNGLKKYLQIPENYKICYVASASEAMEVILRSCVVSHSHHLVNGAFSKKFYSVAKQIGKMPTKEELALGQGKFECLVPQGAELLCLTENETSTGVQIPLSMIAEIRQKNPNTLFAVDVTSSAGGVKHDISQADIWFFSVQKCFGLPAWLGIIIFNEKVLQKTEEVFAKTHDVGAIHSLASMLKKYDDGQTDETPNVFDIFLLSKQLESLNTKWIEQIEMETLEKFRYIEGKLQKLGYTRFVKDDTFASKTVYVFDCPKDRQDTLKATLKKENITIGSGYGDIKDTTLRIANFPSITHEHLAQLFSFFSS